MPGATGVVLIRCPLCGTSHAVAPVPVRLRIASHDTGEPADIRVIVDWAPTTIYHRCETMQDNAGQSETMRNNA